METKLKNVLGLISSLKIFVIIIDQISKRLIINNLVDKKIELISNFFYFDLYLNKGIAFSLPINGAIFPILILSILIFFIYKYGNKYINFNFKLSPILIALILGGAISNIIDRFLYGAVVDFISISKFPVFNIADSCISVSAVLIIVFQKKIFKEK